MHYFTSTGIILSQQRPLRQWLGTWRRSLDARIIRTRTDSVLGLFTLRRGHHREDLSWEVPGVCTGYCDYQDQLWIKDK